MKGLEKWRRDKLHMRTASQGATIVSGLESGRQALGEDNEGGAKLSKLISKPKKTKTHKNKKNELQ